MQNSTKPQYQISNKTRITKLVYLNPWKEINPQNIQVTYKATQTALLRKQWIRIRNFNVLNKTNTGNRSSIFFKHFWLFVAINNNTSLQLL